MKNALKISWSLPLFFVALFFISSCKKDKETSADYLIAADWSLRSSVASPGFLVGLDTITDLYSVMDSCEKDDILRFFIDDIVSIDAGTLKCDSLEPQGKQGYWILIDNETRMVFYNDTINLIEVTSDKLTVSYTIDTIPPTVQTITYTYENVK